MTSIWMLRAAPAACLLSTLAGHKTCHQPPILARHRPALTGRCGPTSSIVMARPTPPIGPTTRAARAGETTNCSSRPKPPRERAGRGRPSGDRGAPRSVGEPRLHVGAPDHERQGRPDLRPHRDARSRRAAGVVAGNLDAGLDSWSQGWPDHGKIDIMEHVSFDQGVVHASVHTRQYNHVRGRNAPPGLRSPMPPAASTCTSPSGPRTASRRRSTAALFLVRHASRRAGAAGPSTRRSTCC